MAKSTVIVGCRLPNGIILEHPNNPTQRVQIAGTKSTKVEVPYVTTEVDKDFWDAWVLVHSDFTPLKNGALFMESTKDRADAKAKELVKEKTGFERAKAKDHGVVAADKE